MPDDTEARLRQALCLAEVRKRQVRTLEDRISRATTALHGKPDVSADKATRAEVAAGWHANDVAWVILTEGHDPPSRRNEASPLTQGNADG